MISPIATGARANTMIHRASLPNENAPQLHLSSMMNHDAREFKAKGRITCLGIDPQLT